MIIEELRDIHKHYPMTWALQGVSLRIKGGEFLLIMGPSGSGKSTLMHIAGLLDLPTKGEVRIMGKPAPREDSARARLRSKFIGFVFQDFGLINSLNVYDNIALPTLFDGGKRDVRGIARELGIEDKLASYPNQLSGGQKQRVAIARALVNDPKLVFADEPTGNLDTRTGEKVMELLRSLVDRGKTVVVVTHNPEHERFADRIIRLRDGKLI